MIHHFAPRKDGKILVRAWDYLLPYLQAVTAVFLLISKRLRVSEVPLHPWLYFKNSCSGIRA